MAPDYTDYTNDKQARKFAEFDAANPGVWRWFVHFTQEQISRRLAHGSATATIARIRWETDIVTDEAYKISNDWSPFYARKWHQEYPTQAEFYLLRPSKADAEMSDDQMDEAA